MSDKSLAAARQEHVFAERAKADAYNAIVKANQEITARAEAKEAEERAREGAEHIRVKYRALFTGISLFTVVVAVLNAYERRHIFLECGTWFADRWQGTISIWRWLVGSFDRALYAIDEAWDLHIVWCYAIAIATLLLILFGAGIVLARLFSKIMDLFRYIGEQYSDGTFKAIMSVAAAISLLYACLFLYEPIKTVLLLNIFSVWLLASLAACLGVNFPEVRHGVKKWWHNRMW